MSAVYAYDLVPNKDWVSFMIKEVRHTALVTKINPKTILVTVPALNNAEYKLGTRNGYLHISVEKVNAPSAVATHIVSQETASKHYRSGIMRQLAKSYMQKTHIIGRVTFNEGGIFKGGSLIASWDTVAKELGISNPLK